MASPIRPKQAVDLATPMPRVSRIRRDPPPPVKVVSAAEIRERDAWSMALGIMLLALAGFVVLIGFSNAAGWSPTQYTIHVKENS